MKIVIAPDSFKGSVSSMDAANAISRAITDVDSSVETVLLPMADGGEGTVEAVLWNRGGEKVSCPAEDPLGRKISPVYGWLEEEKTAIIETAAASGLPLLKKGELDPDQASSYGTGQLIMDALGRGAERIILGLGGSATVDAGTGLFQALGIKFFDEDKRELGRIGGQLHRIHGMDSEGLAPELKTVQILVASDVTNPLLGEEGAIAVFGPQKGIEGSRLPKFEEGMKNFSELAAQTAGRNKSQEPGSGAAGGIGFLLHTFLDVEFRSGLELVAEISELEKHLADADLVLTGEGKIDGQSLFGKVPVGIGRAAKKKAVPVIAFTGSTGPGIENLEAEGLTAVMPITDGPMSLEQAMEQGESLLYEAAKRLMKIIGIGIKLREEEKDE